MNDVDEAIGFSCGRLGFSEDMHPAPRFAMLSHGDLRSETSSENRFQPPGAPGGGHGRRHPPPFGGELLDSVVGRGTKRKRVR